MPTKPNPIVDPDDYQPLKDFLLLEPEQEAEVSEGGIIIPDQARHFLNEGKILKVGPDCSEALQPGMFVTFEGSSEYKLKLAKDLTIFCVRESNLILIREDKSAAKRLFPAESRNLVGKGGHALGRPERQQLSNKSVSCARHSWMSTDPCPLCAAEFQSKFQG